MTDHALLIPTADGPVGGIVSEPPGVVRAGMILLTGAGRPARSGTNSFWTRVARDLCEAGLAVLRIDYSREGETLPLGEGGSGQAWKRELDLRLLNQILPWFRERLDGLDLFLAGSCSGSRGVIELAGRDFPGQVAGTFLAVPHLRVLAGLECQPEQRPGWDELADPDAVEPQMVDYMRTILQQKPSWILVGEHDTADISSFKRLLGPTPHPLEVEVVPGVALHLFDQPSLQEEARRRLLARVLRALPDPGFPL